MTVSLCGLFTFGQKPVSAEIVADVSIRNIEFISKTDSTFKAKFNFENKGGAISGIKYGARLMQGTTTINSFIVSGDVSLAAQETKSVTIEYNLPVITAGKYQVVFDAKLLSGLPIAFAVGPYIDIADRPSITINAQSCYLTILGEKKGIHYTLSEGVDVAPNEKLVINCSVKNSFSQSVKVIPYMAHFLRNRYGESLGGAAYEKNAIDMKSGETKVVQIPIVLQTKAQAYDASLSFRDGAGFESNTIFAHYVVRGASATIQQISLDKTSYAQGESAQAMVSWTGSADSFEGSRAGSGSVLFKPTLSATITSRGVVCGATTVKDVEETLLRENVIVPITKKCPNPSLRVVMLDGDKPLAVANYSVSLKNNAVLDDSDDTESESDTSTHLTLGLISIAALLLAFLARNKKKAVILTLLIGIALSSATVVSAATVTWLDIGGGERSGTASLEKNLYGSGEVVNMVLNFDTTYIRCSNGAKGNMFSAFDVRDPDGQIIRSPSNNIVGGGKFPVINTTGLQPGTYTVDVAFGDNVLKSGMIKSTCTTGGTGGVSDCIATRCGGYNYNNGTGPSSSCMERCVKSPPPVTPVVTSACMVAAYVLGDEFVISGKKGHRTKSGVYGTIELTFDVASPPVIPDPSPKSALDGVGCNTLNGWAYDPSVSEQVLDVHVYKDGAAGTGSFVGAYTANTSRPDVNNAFGIPGNHGFGIPTPDSLKDGQNHSIYIYAIGKDGSGINNSDNPFIVGSPKSLKCDSRPKTCTDSNANNVGQLLPCTYAGKCVDAAASNYNGTLPCIYKKTLTLSSTSCGGSPFVGGGQYDVGSAASFQITLAGGYDFVDWKNKATGVQVSTDTTGSIVMNVDTELVAYCVSSVSTHNPTASLSFSPSTVLPGASVTITGSYTDSDGDLNRATIRSLGTGDKNGDIGTATSVGAAENDISAPGSSATLTRTFTIPVGTSDGAYWFRTEVTDKRVATTVIAWNSVTVGSSSCTPGTPCTSPANNCGTTNSGTYGADCSCGATRPANEPEPCGPGPRTPTSDPTCPQGENCPAPRVCEDGTELDSSNICRPGFSLNCGSGETPFQIIEGFSAASVPVKIEVREVIKPQRLTFTARLLSNGSLMTDAVSYLWNGIVAPEYMYPQSGTAVIFSEPTLSVKVSKGIPKTSDYTYTLDVSVKNEYNITHSCPMSSSGKDPIFLDKSPNNVTVKEH
jgi:hypothetical protein